MRFALLHEDAIPPKRKNPTDAGIDLFAYSEGWGYRIDVGKVVIVRTGVMVEIPKGYFGWITNKSSKDYLVGGGIVDEGFQGELLVKIINVSEDDLYIQTGDAIAQLLIIPHIRPEIELVRPIDILRVTTDRGKDGGIVRQKFNDFYDQPISPDLIYDYTADDLNYDANREDEIFGRDI